MNDDTFDKSTTSGATNQVLTGARRFPCPAQALYDFAATSGDELTMALNEEITVVGIGDGEGWVKVSGSKICTRNEDATDAGDGQVAGLFLRGGVVN
jgi:hypothetical protein